MKLRSVLCLLIVAGLLSLTLAADDKSASKQAQGVKQNSQAATKAASPEKAKAQSGKGFDTKELRINNLYM
jgi:cytochrome oxidase Cu insertion factor (SCO1/SenC/PrrC family)